MEPNQPIGRKKASEFPQELLNLFDGYVHGGISRRAFLDGAQKFAVGGVTSVGGYPGDEEKAAALFSQVDRGKMTEDFVASANWLKSRPDGSGKLGAIGFCFGGGIVNQLAVRMGGDLAAGVPFYGAQPK